MIRYNSCDFFMIRIPLFSVNDYLNMFDDLSKLNIRLNEVFNTNLLRESLTVASDDLLKAIDKNDFYTTSKSSKQIRSSLIKYFIRLSTRPTPFGLFSGISIGRFDEISNITVSNPQQYTKRARPDTEWIYGLIKKIEANNNIRSSLRLRFNEFTHTNGSRMEKPNKTFLQLEENSEVKNELATSIRYTNQVKMIEKKCYEYHSFSNILDEIVSRNPNALISKIETFLSQLIENEFLLSELRPPLINTDMLNYLLNSLKKINDSENKDLNFYIKKLNEIQRYITNYNATPIGKGVNNYNEIIRLQKELHECKSYLQVDMKTYFETNTLDYNLKSDLERFVSAMLRLIPSGKTSDEMAHYIDLFIEKYGYSAEIPVMELLDIDQGLGAPAHYQGNVINRTIPKQQKHIKEQRLHTLLERKLMLTLREGKKLIEITDDDIDYICEDESHDNVFNPMDYLQSFELYLLAHPGADYSFTLAPALMSDGFGKTFGRFNDMLTEEETLLLKEGFEKNKTLLDGYVIAEISELPSTGRTSNVTINNSDYDYQISLTTNPCDSKQILSVRDLYIGVDPGSNKFYVKSKSLDKKVIVTMTSMINPTFGSNVLRFLREVSTARSKNIMNGIINIMNLPYEYCPRITYGKIIIKPETWIISKNIMEIQKEKDNNEHTIEKKFSLFRQKWGIPRYVFLNESDNRLLLDLDNSAHRNEMYNVLKKNIAMPATLTEIGCDFGDYATIDADRNNYITEIVVPFILASDNVKNNKKANDSDDDKILKTISNVSTNRMKIDRKELMLLPGNGEWLYYKLYGCSKRQNELIAIAYEILEKFVAEGLAQKYFFIRYSDPEPHLRLRIQPSEKGISVLFTALSDWLNSLYNDGIISKAVSDSYIRETERYGGPKLIEYAEDYFYNDSKLVMNLLSIQRYKKQNFNIDYVGISFVVSVLEAFGLSIDEQAIFLDSISDKKSYRKEFQNEKKMIMYAVDSSDDWFGIRMSTSNSEIYDLITMNSKTLKGYVEAIYASDQHGELTNSIKEIAQSIIHMFCNRIMGNNAWEYKIYALTRHGVNGLKGFLKHNQNRSILLELPESLI